MYSVRTAPAAALAAVVLLIGCTKDQPKDTAQDQPKDTAQAATVTVTAVDYGFEAPATMRAGVNTVHLVNRGKELHQAQLIRIAEGKTMADVAKALKTAGPPPKWIKFVGGPNGIAPGQEARATSMLAPGQYAYLCLIPSPDGVMHAAKGMVRPFEVTGDSAASAGELPSADLTITLKDYEFQSSKPLTPGRHTILVENAGPQPHEVVLLKLAAGKTVEDFALWAEGGMKGPPPAEPLGGVTVLDQGGKGSFSAELTAGDYGLICFVPDAKDGKPHLAHGMMRTIKVG
jgi:plastocyanin